MIDDKVKLIKGREYAGSSLRNGKMYHNLPFDGLDRFKSHRGKTRDRIEQIKKLVKVKGKSILDLGCSVGGISLGMAEAGAKRVVGYDYDLESIEVAKAAAKELGYDGRVFFNHQSIDANTAQMLLPNAGYNIIIWLSQWMWSVKQCGLEESKQLLFYVSENAPILVFESAANDGMAKIKGATQADIKKWLYENTVYRIIDEHDSVGGWIDRKLYVCSEPMIKYKKKGINTSSIIDRISPNEVKKTFVGVYKPLVEREKQALTLLADYPHFPKIIRVEANSLVMDFVGHPISELNHEMGLQLMEIYNILGEVGIVHRDIRIENLLWNGSQLFLIDFGKSGFKQSDHRYRVHRKEDEQLILKLYDTNTN